MKLAFCLFKYFPYGGLQRDFLRIAMQCLERGHTVDVYTMEWQGDKPSNLNIHILPIKNITNHGRALSFSKSLEKILKANKYDVVFGFNKISGLDIYYCADSCYLDKTNEQKSFIKKILYKFTARYKIYKKLESSVFDKNNTKLLFLSENESNRYKKYYNYQDKNSFILPPNIDKSRFDRNIYIPKNKNEYKIKLKNKLSNEFGNIKINLLDANNVWLLMVGSGFKTKGVDRSILALKYLVENNIKVNLIVIGQDDPSKFIKLAKKIDIINNIIFLNGRSDIPEFMMACDVLLHPAYRENTGTVLLESIVMGLPVIATETCGYAKYITQSECGEVAMGRFQQDKFNQTVYNFIDNKLKYNYVAKSQHFSETADIYNADSNILQIIENLNKQTSI